MKVFLLLLLLVSVLPVIQAQQKYPVSHDREYYLNRSRNKKLPGYILLAGGIGGTVLGIAASSSSGGIVDLSDIGPPIILGGFAFSACGIALLRSARKDMIRAVEVSAGHVKVPTAEGLVSSAISMQPAIVFFVKFR